MRNFCFTLNNYTMKDFDLMCDLECDYIVFGYETGEEGTEHIQGYCELNKQLRLKNIKKYLPRAHIEARKGSPLQASEYCKKEGNWTEGGIISNPGKRNDLVECKEMIDNGASLEEVADNYPRSFIQYQRGFRDYQNLKKTFDHKDCEVQVAMTGEIYDYAIDGACLIDGVDDISEYEGEECMVIHYSHRSAIEKLARGIPLKIKYGYELRTIKPRYVIAWMPFIGKEDSLRQLVEMTDLDLFANKDKLN